jgi:hypothetical protein
MLEEIGTTEINLEIINIARITEIAQEIDPIVGINRAGHVIIHAIGIIQVITKTKESKIKQAIALNCEIRRKIGIHLPTLRVEISPMTDIEIPLEIDTETTDPIPKTETDREIVIEIIEVPQGIDIDRTPEIPILDRIPVIEENKLRPIPPTRERKQQTAQMQKQKL